MHSGDRFLYGFKPGRLGPDVPPLHPAMRSLPLRGGQPDRSLSGQTTRHRLNRGGDRALNKAIHIIANTRMRSDPSTQAYMLRRRAEGKSDREIRRCIKRYIARQLYRNAAKLEARLGALAHCLATP